MREEESDSLQISIPCIADILLLTWITPFHLKLFGFQSEVAMFWASRQRECEFGKVTGRQRTATVCVCAGRAGVAIVDEFLLPGCRAFRILSWSEVSLSVVPYGTQLWAPQDPGILGFHLLHHIKGKAALNTMSLHGWSFLSSIYSTQWFRTELLQFHTELCWKAICWFKFILG